MASRRRSIRSERLGRPLGPWDRTPAGIRAALISTPLLLGLFLVNGIGIGIFSSTALTAALICYPAQVLAYGFNGWLAGQQARSSFGKSTRTVGLKGQVVRHQRPDYLPQGALAGFLLSLVGLLVYFAVGLTANSLLPGLALLGSIGATAVLFLIVDVAVCVGAGILGAIIYDRVFD